VVVHWTLDEHLVVADRGNLVVDGARVPKLGAVVNVASRLGARDKRCDGGVLVGYHPQAPTSLRPRQLQDGRRREGFVAAAERATRVVRCAVRRERERLFKEFKEFSFCLVITS
jgi:hypothetical protein